MELPALGQPQHAVAPCGRAPLLLALPPLDAACRASRQEGDARTPFVCVTECSCLNLACVSLRCWSAPELCLSPSGLGRISHDLVSSCPPVAHVAVAKGHVCRAAASRPLQGRRQRRCSKKKCLALGVPWGCVTNVQCFHTLCQCHARAMAPSICGPYKQMLRALDGGWRWVLKGLERGSLCCVCACAHQEQRAHASTHRAFFKPSGTKSIRSSQHPEPMHARAHKPQASSNWMKGPFVSRLLMILIKSSAVGEG